MPKCSAKKADGSACHAYALRDEDKCLFHSDSDRTKKLKGRKNIFSKEHLILELQQLLRKVKREKGDTLERSREIRMLISLISELKGERPLEPEKKSEFEKKIDKWKTKQ